MTPGESRREQARAGATRVFLAAHRPTAVRTLRLRGPRPSPVDDQTQPADRDLAMSGASVKPPEMKASITWHSLRVNGLRSPQAVERSIGAHVHDAATKLCHGRKRPGVNILDGLEGTLKGGEMLLVLGKPGSGCTTFLKALAGRLEGLELDTHSEVTYRGA